MTDAVLIGVRIEGDDMQMTRRIVVRLGGIERAERRLLRGRCRASVSRTMIESLHDESAGSRSYADGSQAEKELLGAGGKERSVYVRETRRWEEEGGTRSSRKTSAAE